jgi:hypothetical protein
MVNTIDAFRDYLQKEKSILHTVNAYLNDKEVSNHLMRLISLKRL